MNHPNPIKPDSRSHGYSLNPQSQADFSADLHAVTNDNLHTDLTTAAARVITQIRHDRIDLRKRTSDNTSSAYDLLARKLDELESAVHDLAVDLSPINQPFIEAIESNSNSTQPQTER